MTTRRAFATAVLALAALVQAAVPGQAAAPGQAVQEPAVPAAPVQQAAAAALPGHEVFRGGPVTVDNFTHLTLACPAGKVVVGGGGEAHGQAGVLMGSFPSTVGGAHGWNVVARQVGQAKVSASGYVICVNSAALPGYQLINLPSADIANRSSREAVCPAGKVRPVRAGPPPVGRHRPPLRRLPRRPPFRRRPRPHRSGCRVNVLWALLRDGRCYELTPPTALAA
ncbi:hypothetical protein ACWGF3_33300 [Streptomyces xanthophaeus]